MKTGPSEIGRDRAEMEIFTENNRRFQHQSSTVLPLRLFVSGKSKASINIDIDHSLSLRLDQLTIPFKTQLKPESLYLRTGCPTVRLSGWLAVM